MVTLLLLTFQLGISHFNSNLNVRSITDPFNNPQPAKVVRLSQIICLIFQTGAMITSTMSADGGMCCITIPDTRANLGMI